MRPFTVYISGEVLIDAKDFLDEGEVPEGFTAKDAAEAMRAYGPKLATLRDWALLDDLRVSIDLEDVWP